jgi:hypothetical protein
LYSVIYFQCQRRWDIIAEILGILSGWLREERQPANRERQKKKRCRGPPVVAKVILHLSSETLKWSGSTTEMQPLLQFRDMWIFSPSFFLFLLSYAESVSLQTASSSWHVVPSPSKNYSHSSPATSLTGTKDGLLMCIGQRWGHELSADMFPVGPCSPWTGYSVSCDS